VYLWAPIQCLALKSISSNCFVMLWSQDTWPVCSSRILFHFSWYQYCLACLCLDMNITTIINVFHAKDVRIPASTVDNFFKQTRKLMTQVPILLATRGTQRHLKNCSNSENPFYFRNFCHLLWESDSVGIRTRSCHWPSQYKGENNLH